MGSDTTRSGKEPLVRICLPLCLVAVLFSVSVQGRAQGQNTSGDYATADVRVITPGVVFSSGLPDIAAGFTKDTGKKVGIVVVGMGTIVEEMKKRTPPPDMIVLPF